MLAPLRLTTASAPASTAGSSGSGPLSHGTSPGAEAGRRTRMLTSTPSARRLSTRALPISPEAPATTTRRVSGKRCLEGDLDPGQRLRHRAVGLGVGRDALEGLGVDAGDDRIGRAPCGERVCKYG